MMMIGVIGHHIKSNTHSHTHISILTLSDSYCAEYSIVPCSKKFFFHLNSFLLSGCHDEDDDDGNNDNC